MLITFSACRSSNFGLDFKDMAVKKLSEIGRKLQKRPRFPAVGIDPKGSRPDPAIPNGQAGLVLLSARAGLGEEAPAVAGLRARFSRRRSEVPIISIDACTAKK
jgi:hypothetical protein